MASDVIASDLKQTVEYGYDIALLITLLWLLSVLEFCNCVFEW